MGIAAVAKDPKTGYSHCLGVGGAAAYLVCERLPPAMFCVHGLDYVEFYKVENSGLGGAPISELSDEDLIALFRTAGNADVLEAVLDSFHYR